MHVTYKRVGLNIRFKATISFRSLFLLIIWSYITYLGGYKLRVYLLTLKGGDCTWNYDK